MVRLGVNIDHVATIRQARRADEPDPVHAAVLAELGGADGITVHLREDRRHIQDRDVEVLRQMVTTRLNLEMATTQEMIRIALTVKPDQVTLVPERREELTTEGGLDVVLNSAQLKPVVKTLQEGGIHVSMFVDPDLEQVKESAPDRRPGGGDQHRRLLPTPADERSRETALRKVVDAARLGRKLGLAVHAGHGLTYANVGAVAAVAEIARAEHRAQHRGPGGPGGHGEGGAGDGGGDPEAALTAARAKHLSFRDQHDRSVRPRPTSDGGGSSTRTTSWSTPRPASTPSATAWGATTPARWPRRWPSRRWSPSSRRATRKRRSPGPTAWRPSLSFDGNRLKTAIKLANKRVYKAADNREDYTGMGTTVVAALVTGNVATIGSAGRQPLLPVPRGHHHAAHARRLLGLRGLGRRAS